MILGSTLKPTREKRPAKSVEMERSIRAKHFQCSLFSRISHSLQYTRLKYVCFVIKLNRLNENRKIFLLYPDAHRWSVARSLAHSLTKFPNGFLVFSRNTTNGLVWLMLLVNGGWWMAEHVQCVLCVVFFFSFNFFIVQFYLWAKNSSFFLLSFVIRLLCHSLTIWYTIRVDNKFCTINVFPYIPMEQSLCRLLLCIADYFTV